MRRSIVLVLTGGLAAGTLMLLVGAAGTEQGDSVGRYHLAQVRRVWEFWDNFWA